MLHSLFKTKILKIERQQKKGALKIETKEIVVTHYIVYIYTFCKVKVLTKFKKRNLVIVLIFFLIYLPFALMRVYLA